MNQTTEKLIRELANKLGTTTEHLWGVLIRQAAISGITNLIVVAAWLAIAWWFYSVIKRKTLVPPETPEDKYPRAEWDGDSAGIAWGILWLSLAGCAVIFGCTLESVIGSLVNPEYWALKQIVK